LISGISVNVDINNVIDPENIIIPGTLYGFNDSYVQTSELEPGKGYWLNANNSGEIMLSASAIAARIKTFQPTENLNTLTLNNTLLYFGADIPQEELMNYSLPPKPFAPAKDIRFSGDAKFCPSDECVIEVMNHGQPLVFECDVKDGENWEILDESGNVLLSATADKCSSAQILELSGESEMIVLRKTTSTQTPSEFSFYPAHPNPFNPTTTIRFSTKMDSHSSLRIYDITGKLVETLVDENLPSGNHNIKWHGTDKNGTKMSSGVYFIQLKSGLDFIQTEKVLLIK
jgi:hypothetical protein